MADGSARPRRPTPAERRERRAAVDDPAEVVDAAARFLEARPRSVAEVRRRLTSAGYRSELVESAITRMSDLGYLDDEAFSRTWVESRDRAHPRGEQALRRELRLKGIAPALIDEILEQRRAAGEGADADLGAAERLLERNARALARVADPRLRRNRAYALLARNGFDPSIAADAARRFVDGAADAWTREAVGAEVTGIEGTASPGDSFGRGTGTDVRSIWKRPGRLDDETLDGDPHGCDGRRRDAGVAGNRDDDPDHGALR